MKIVKSIPNFITSLNLLSGSIAITQIVAGNNEIAFGLIILAMIFDFLDGFSARMLKAYSEIGKQLDSLADLISFGLAPSYMMFELLTKKTICFNNACFLTEFFPYIAFLVVIFSAVRLAKFNVDDRQSSSFIGLPTPANALLISSWCFIPENSIFATPLVLFFLILISSYLLISELPMFSFKVKELKFVKLLPQIILIIGSLIFAISFRNIYAGAAIIVLYIVINLLVWAFAQKEKDNININKHS
ncbi:MAG: CDP-diacylglycerol--serine O-phosphatidyltransferase [Bacteroidales bacterium]|jgi:CDP-diacylglycerol--serine O-phosphatidyltransferase